ncbi:primosomal replication protein N'' [Shimwellia pseudoproteus]|uniref:primosomal replication protein PriC n=1 Tax=Shimwellia pseudoproteus TaxID=570012 RepID=UPI0018EC39CE|nr:primosomal replication protein PriC [Shimwellia pseudoproteus]MBJ3814644.1 primosomal replication protein N'' [Shimwellia pseudoproteus]
MKTRLLIDRLTEQCAALNAQIAPLAAHNALTPRFDRQLFQCRSSRMGDYLQETEQNLNHLRSAVAVQDNAKVSWLAEHLVNQIAALSREAATWQLRGHDSAHLYTGRLHRQLLQHQEYERRLLAMCQQRRQQWNDARQFDEQQRLAREVTVLEGRLARCREALDNIVRQLARRTR